jgi:hypothetical protein
MAVEDFGGSALGRPVQVLSVDHQDRADTALGIASEWYDQRVARVPPGAFAASETRPGISGGR